MVGILLFFWLLLGVYGFYRSEIIELKWKNLGYVIVVLVILLLVLVFLG